MKPEYWEKAKRSLIRRDPVLAEIIRRHPRVHLVQRGEPFHTLAREIVGQQLWVAAAQSVWNKFSGVALEIIPERILKIKAPQMRACGLSERKCEYISDLARRFADGKVHVHRWPGMDDEEVIEDLVQVRGIGRWTAEMFLMFNLLRPDVFPLGDLGLQKGLQVAYHGGRKISLKTMKTRGNTLRPWRSVATWYLWRAPDTVPGEY